MDTRQAYNVWAKQYDTNENKTRDLEAVALRTELSSIEFENCLEIGCGTGKNTEWLVQKSERLTGVDLSEEMLQKAREKIQSDKVRFVQADITKPWSFGEISFDLVTFSLVLEHIENLDFIFSQVVKVSKQGGYVYVGELHPFKQYSGSKARFETEEGLQVVQCYTHHLSEFSHLAKRHGLRIVEINEYFDDNDRSLVPRIITMSFQLAE